MIHQHIVRITDSLIGVASGHMFLTKQVSGLMHLRRKGLCGIGRAENRLQRLIFYLHQFLRLLQNFRRFRRHKADGITQEMCDLPHRDHGVPILHEMAHLHLAGNILSGINSNYTGQRLGFFFVNGQHSCPGIFAAHSTAVDHAIQTDVIGILACTQHLFPGIDARHCLAHTGAVFLLRNLPTAAEYLRRK